MEDYFYLPSTTELGFVNEQGGAEGAAFPYFNSNDRRIKQYNENNTNWIIRTPQWGYSFYNRAINATGSLSAFMRADYIHGVPAVCNII